MEKMNFSGRQRVLLETNLARDRAEALLTSLIEAQRAVDREMPPHLAGDIVSRKSMDRAIGTTKRAIAMLTDAIERAARDVDDESLAVLDLILDDDETVSASAAPVTPVDLAAPGGGGAATASRNIDPQNPRRHDAPTR